MNRTYEELKLRTQRRVVEPIVGLNRTYEELKLSLLGCAKDQAVKSLNRTYEELKHLGETKRGNIL